MAEGTIKTAFTVIGFAIAAALLYIALFGAYTFQSGSTITKNNAKSTSGERWKGALFFAADSLEASMSQYYYDYCYLPSYYSDIWADEALGGKPIDVDNLTAPTNLSNSKYSGTTGYYEFEGETPSTSNTQIYYSESWH